MGLSAREIYSSFMLVGLASSWSLVQGKSRPTAAGKSGLRPGPVVGTLYDFSESSGFTAEVWGTPSICSSCKRRKKNGSDKLSMTARCCGSSSFNTPPVFPISAVKSTSLKGEGPRLISPSLEKVCRDLEVFVSKMGLEVSFSSA